MAKTIVDDIPATGKARTDAEEKARKKIVRQYENLVRDKMSQITSNAGAYVNQRAHSKSGVGIELRKVIKAATFIAAHKSRFKPGAFVVEETKYFILHRPGRNAAASRLDNVIREFVQANRVASTHFVIGQSGALVQMVDLGDLAFHTGTKRGPLSSDSVGVEIEGAVGQPFTPAALNATAELIATIAAISGMPINDKTVLNHSTILPKQKTDAWITKRSKGVVTDSRLQQLILAANERYKKILATPPADGFYKEPFDPRQDAATKVGELMALAAAPGTTFLEMSRVQSAAASQAALSRTMGYSTINRGIIGVSAALFSSGAVDQIGKSLASFIRDNNIRAVPTPQENNVGVLYDPDTGLLNDGKPV